MKFCMVNAGNSEFFRNAVSAADKIGYTATHTEKGIGVYSAGDGDNVKIAIIDIEASSPAEIIERLEILAKDRQLMLFCPTPDDTARMRNMLDDFPGHVSILPFNPVG